MHGLVGPQVLPGPSQVEIGAGQSNSMLMVHPPIPSQHAPVGGCGHGLGVHVVPGAIRVPKKQDGNGEYAATGVHPPSASQQAAMQGLVGPQSVPAPSQVAIGLGH